MKTTNRNPLLVAGLCALALSFGAAAYAEKGAETLVRLTKGSAPAKNQTALAIAHKCANCTDTVVSVVDKATKGPNHPLSNIARHNCKACNTKTATEGTGKAKQNIAIHSCNGQVKPLCCARN